MTPTATQVSIVIPALNEQANIARTILSVREHLPNSEIIVADGGSADKTVSRAEAEGARVVGGPSGRGNQCNAGAAVATGELLVFLHADTVLSGDVQGDLDKALADPAFTIANFRLRFDSHSLFLRTCAWCSQMDTLFSRFGDQGIVIRRSFYDEIGHFPDWPLFEDVELLRRARKTTRIRLLTATATTSARRFHQNGIFRQQMKNGLLICRYLAGTPPERLATEYQRQR